MEKRYEIGGAAYVQRPLVLGQVRQLLEVLDGVRFAPDADPFALVAALGDRLALALAVVLTPEGQSPRGKDLPALADELEFAIAPEQVLEVVEDFFGCNPMASLVERLTGAAATVAAGLRATAPALGSKTSASCSAPETSAGESACSGATPPPSASPGCATASAT